MYIAEIETRYWSIFNFFI